MRPAPRRFPVIRPPSRRTVVVVVLALVVGLVVHRTVADAEAAVARLGPTVDVVVVVRDVAPGARVEAGDVALASRPVVHVPAGVVGSVDEVVGLRTTVGLVAGEVVVGTRLAGGAGSAAGAVVPEGWRAVAIPAFDSPLPVEVGDRVEIVASFDPTLTERPTRLLVPDGLVVAVDEDAVTVAMPAADVTDVAFALVNGIVLLALVG